MDEKTSLLPSAPDDVRFIASNSQQVLASTVPLTFACGPECQAAQQLEQIGQQQTYIPMPRITLAPGLEFNPARKYRYGMHSAGAAFLIFIAFILIEIRDCDVGIGIDLDRLQALHISMLVIAFVIYILSLFGIADFIFQFRLFFLAGVLSIFTFVGLMLWMTYEAAVNPCVKTFNAPIDFSFGTKNVFARGDGVGITVLLLDIFATLLMISAAGNFYKRH